MALKIRLRQHGCKNHKVYRIVVTDSRSPRDGKYIESIGWYNPQAREGLENSHLHPDRLQHWLDHGAQPSETVTMIAKQQAPTVLEQYKQKLQARRVARSKARKSTKAA